MDYPVVRKRGPSETELAPPGPREGANAPPRALNPGQQAGKTGAGAVHLGKVGGTRERRTRKCALSA